MKRRFVRLFFYLISLVIKIYETKKVRFVLHPSYGFGAADE